MNRILLAEIFFIGILVAVMHKIALSLSLYWNVFWFDILMHFLGGLLIGLLAIFFTFDRGFVGLSFKKPLVVFAVAIGATLIVGLGWELWELFVGFTNVMEDKFDTVLDIIMDTLGAILAFQYSKNKICKEEN